MTTYRPFGTAQRSGTKADLLRAVNVERERRRNAMQITMDGILYDADEESRTNLTGLLTASSAGVPVPWPVPWRCGDNVTRALSQVQAATLAAMILDAVHTLYSKSWYLKDVTIPALADQDVPSFDVAADVWWA